MTFRRRLDFWFVALLCAVLQPTVSFALNETYEGVLEPGNTDPKVPIVVEVRDTPVGLQGTVKTSAPLKGEGPITLGDYAFGQCRLDVDLSPTLTLRLSGGCDATGFEGSFALHDKPRRTLTYGTFNLRKATAKQEDKQADAGPGCLKAHTRCMLSCPRTEERADFVCSNRCRARLKACKAQTKKAPL